MDTLCRSAVLAVSVERCMQGESQGVTVGWRERENGTSSSTIA